MERYDNARIDMINYLERLDILDHAQVKTIVELAKQMSNGLVEDVEENKLK